MEKEYRLMTISPKGSNMSIGAKTKDLKKLRSIAKVYSEQRKMNVEILEVFEVY